MCIIHNVQNVKVIRKSSQVTVTHSHWLQKPVRMRELCAVSSSSSDGCYTLPSFQTWFGGGGGRTQVEKYFCPGEITQQIYHWQILPIIFLRSHVPNEFPTNLLMGFVVLLMDFVANATC